MKKKIKSTTVFRINNPMPDQEAEKKHKGFTYNQTTYDENGQVLTEKRFSEDGEMEERTENKYDANGNLLEEITYLEGDEVAEHMTYERDGKGQVIVAYKHYQDGDRDTIRYDRDEAGRLIEKTTIDSYDEIEAREVMAYVKDKVTSRKVFEYDEMVLEESYAYDGEGKITSHDYG